MEVLEARRGRDLVVRLEQGDELPGALVRALDGAEAKSGWVQGEGVLEAAELTVFDAERRTWSPVRRIATPCAIVSLTGSIAALAGETSLRLSVTLARETDRGLELIGGELVSARAISVDLGVRVLDDLPLVRVADARTGLVALGRAGSSGALAQAPAPLPAPAPDEPREPPPAPASEPAPHRAPDALRAGFVSSGPPVPVRPARPKDEVEIYPEPGDRVSHFHFGECFVVSSDGERIRLRQERDGRVREVALTMLKIEPPTTHADGARHFRLERKH